MNEDVRLKSSVGVIGAGIQGVCISLFLIEKGFNQEYGVRYLNREIQNLIEDPLSELLLEKTFANSVGVKVDMKINKLSILPILKKPNKKKARSKAVKKSHKSVKSKS